MMHRTPSPLSILLALMFVFVSLPAAQATWSDDPSFNTAVSYSGMHYSTSTADGAGGVFVLSYYLTAGDDKNHYIQCIDSDGNRTFNDWGVEFYSSADGWDPGVQVVADGLGGAFVAWSEDDGTKGKVYTQHFGADGSPSWGLNVGVCSYPSNQMSPKAVSDGVNGIIVGWIDGANYIYNQRISINGELLWNEEGMSAALTSGTKYSLEMAKGDLPGHSLLIWHEGDGSAMDIYAMKMNDLGAKEFSTSTMSAISTASGLQFAPLVVSNGAGGLIALFQEDPSGVGNGPFEVKLQFKSNLGSNHWNNGTGMGGFYTHQDNPSLAPDGAGGAFVGYLDHGLSGNRAAVKHVNANYSFNWGVYGRTYHDEKSLSSFSMIADGLGGFFTAIEDPTDNNYLKADHYDVDGFSLWMPDHEHFSNGPSGGIIDLFADAAGGVVAVWDEPWVNTYAQRTDELGFMGLNSPLLISATDRPNDQGGEVILTWQASARDRMGLREITGYSMWIRQPAKAASALPVLPVLPVLKNNELAELLKMSEAEVTTIKSRGWTFTGQVPAILTEEYSALCPTFGDSTDTEIVLTDFMVMAHHLENGIAWFSPEVLTGFSVDNIAPGAPANLAGELDGNLVNLSWLASGHHDEDLAYYRVYRGNEAGFQPDENSLLIETADVVFADDTAGAVVYYQVTAVDAHGNEGSSSNEVMVLLGASAVEEIPVVFNHRGNYPNPFNPMTNIAFDLPSDARVQVSIYDAGGRLVTVIINESFMAGQHEVRWNGQDTNGRGVSSGVYYSRIEAGSWSSTRTMTLVR